jgi:mRNA interferase RelE/StbE
MARYRIEVKKSAAKELSGIPKRDLLLILARIQSLADSPRPPGSVKLTAEEKYRIRQGSYRILYTVEDGVLTVYIVKVAHRKDAHR